MVERGRDRKGCLGGEISDIGQRVSPGVIRFERSSEGDVRIDDPSFSFVFGFAVSASVTPP